MIWLALKIERSSPFLLLLFVFAFGLSLFCVEGRSHDFGGHHNHFGIGQHGNHHHSYNFIDSDGKGYHAGNDMRNEVGKDKNRVKTNAKLTATVMASDDHMDSYLENHESEHETHAQQSADHMVHEDAQQERLLHRMDAVVDGSDSDDDEFGFSPLIQGSSMAAPTQKADATNSAPLQSNEAPAAAPAASAAGGGAATKA